MRRLASVASVCEINPRIPTNLRRQAALPISFLPMASVLESGTITDISERALGDALKGYRYFEEGDVLVAKITPCMENGKAVQAIGLPHRVGFGSTEFHVLRPGDDVDGRYLFHMVWNPMFRHAAAKRMTGSAGQRRVPSSFFEQFKIPLPPLPEQRRIAAILDKADAVRRKHLQTLDFADQFLHSAFLDLFGDPVTNPKCWQVVEFGELLTDISYGTSKKCVSEQAAGMTPILRIPNVLGGQISWDDLKHCALDDRELAKLRLGDGDLLFVRTNGNPEYVGRCAVFGDGGEPVAFASYLIRARLREEAEAAPIFLREQVSFPTYRGCLIRETRTTAGNYNISSTGLKRLRLILPPMREQEQLLHAVEAIVRLRQKCEAAQTREDALLGSLSQRAFRGDL